MEKVTLHAEARHTGRHPIRELRNVKRVPAVVYGQGMEAQPISLDVKALGSALHRSGGGVIEMEIPGQLTLHVLVREVQRHPTKHNVLHADFLAVSMTEKVRLHVSVVHEGHAPILSNLDMVLVRGLDNVEIECLPGDIPQHLVADLTKLLGIDDEVLVKDLGVPSGVKVLTEGDRVVFAVAVSRAAVEEEAKEAETAAPSPDEVELVAKRKPKEEVAEEKK
jgi:large subunit ribosomal protein L25